MKKYIITLIMLVCLLSFDVQAQSFNTIPVDHQQHFAIGYIMSTSLTSVTYLITKDKRKSIAIGFMGTLLIAAGKEFYDSQGHGRATGQDLLISAMGAGLGTITISITL